MSREFHCSGTDFEMGLQQGKAMKPMIDSAFQSFFEFEGFKNLKPAFLDTDMAVSTAGNFIQRFMFPHIEKFDPGIFQRIKGLAEGAGMDVFRFMFIQFVESLVTSPLMIASGCTVAVFSKSRTFARTPMIVKDYDLFNFTSAINMVRQSRPTGGGKLSSMELIIPMFAGNHIGINEAGLAISYNYGGVKTNFRRNIPPTLIAQYALEHFCRTKQAIEFISRVGSANGAIFSIVDETDDTAIVESLGSNMAVIRPTDGLIYASNIFVEPSMLKYNYKDTDIFNHFAPKAYQGIPINRTSVVRYRRMKELLLARRPKHRFSMGEFMRIQRDHDGKKIGDDTTICRHSSVLSTLAGVVVNVRERKMTVAFGNPCESKYEEYRLQ